MNTARNTLVLTILRLYSKGQQDDESNKKLTPMCQLLLRCRFGDCLCFTLQFQLDIEKCTQQTQYKILI